MTSATVPRGQARGAGDDFRCLQIRAAEPYIRWVDALAEKTQRTRSSLFAIALADFAKANRFVPPPARVLPPGTPAREK